MCSVQEQEYEGVDFDVCPAIYWVDSKKISYLQRRIIVHSILYYSMHTHVISDGKFDALCRQLVLMQEQADFQEFRKSTYYYVMYDFDGSTGYYLYSRLTKYDKRYLSIIAQNVLMSFKRNKEKGENK